MFKSHSTILGLSAAAVVTSLIGWASAWHLNMIVYIVVGLAAVWVFARVFYGFGTARELDRAATEPGSIGVGRHGFTWDGEPANPLERAYLKYQLGDPSELQKIAEEEPG